MVIFVYQAVPRGCIKRAGRQDSDVNICRGLRYISLTAVYQAMVSSSLMTQRYSSTVSASATRTKLFVPPLLYLAENAPAVKMSITEAGSNHSLLQSDPLNTLQASSWTGALVA